MQNPVVRYALLIAAGLGITVVTGIVCGRATHRWGPAPDMLAAAERLQTLPARIGDWQLAEEIKMPALVVDTLQCAGYVNRRYVNRKSGETVNLAIIVGPAGPVSVHTPEICYSSQAYSIEEPREAKELVDSAGDRNAFWYTTFHSTDAIAEQLRVYYGWSTDKGWQATESPRFEFAGQPLLYKLQIAGTVAPGETEIDTDPCQDFLEQLLKTGWKLRG